MAITFDSANSSGSSSSLDTLAHTCSGSDRLLVVGITGGTAITVTYNGVSMTKVGSSPVDSSGPTYLNIFVLYNPSTGSNNIVTSGGVSKIVSASYNGVYSDYLDQNSIVAGSTATIIPTYVKTWLVGIGHRWPGNTNQFTAITTGGNITSQRSGTAQTTPLPHLLIGDSNGEITISSSNSIVITRIGGTGGDGGFLAAALNIRPIPLLVESTDVDDVDFSTATGNGEVLSDGDETITERGFVVSTSPNPTISDMKFVTAGTTGSFSTSITGLVGSTTYYGRAFATNADGTVYGDDVEFTTLSEEPNKLYKDISGVQDASYAVRVVVGGTTGSITVSLGSTGDSLVILAGTTDVLIGTYNGVSGIIIEASVDFDGTVDDVFWVRLFDEDAVIDWNSDSVILTFPINSSVTFKRVEDDEFNRFRIYRYLDLKFKDLNAQVTVRTTKEASDVVTNKTKAFSVGSGVENTVPFLKKRVSFLSKGQAIIIGLSNNRLNETFTICEFTLTGFDQPKKLFAPSKIISM
jgi:hypothetical protein